jgi:hypothetical protein
MKKTIIFLVFIVCSLHKNDAQTYCIGFANVPGSNNGTTMQVDVTVPITGPTFNLGTSNFVFNFNHLALSNPTLISHSLNSFYYNPSTVTNPLTGVASFNLELLFPANGIPISSFTTRIQFTIVDNTKPTGFSTYPYSAFSSPVFKDDEFTQIPSGSNCTVSNFALPVELISFQARNMGKTNLLTWQTATEKNSSHYDIERSADGRSFGKIGNVKAYNQDNQSYTFTDDTPLKLGYYRLKMVDNDGSFTFSKIISIKKAEGSKVKIYPSVTNGFLTVEGAKSFEILNTIGQTVLSEQSSIPNALVNISHLENGFYFIRVENTEGDIFTEKIVKQ